MSGRRPRAQLRRFAVTLAAAAAESGSLSHSGDTLSRFAASTEFGVFSISHGTQQRVSVDTSVRDSRRRSRGPQPPIKDNHAESHAASGEIGRRMHTT